nr:hypothetical protein [Tanacetum cinerariifolium]
MMTVKYCPKSEVKKLEVDLWNLRVKGTDISSYTLRSLQEKFPEVGKQKSGKSRSGWEWKSGGKSIWTRYCKRKPKRQCRDGYVPLKRPLCFDFV